MCTIRDFLSDRKLKMTSSLLKAAATGNSKTSFLIEDILTTKSSPVFVSTFSNPSQDSPSSKNTTISNTVSETTEDRADRVFTAAAAMLGTRTVAAAAAASAAGQCHGSSLLASSTAALQRQLHAAAFYASFESTTSASVHNAYRFPNNDNLPGFV